MGKSTDEENPEIIDGTATKVDADEEVDGSESPTPKEAELAEAPDFETQFNKMEKEFLYLRAEFENYKRNAIKERSQLLKFGSERLARDLLESLDVFSQAIDSEVTKENYSNFVDGIKMTREQLKKSLEKHGIVELEDIGENFDPVSHEALGSEPTDEFQPGQICRVFKSTYKYHDKVLRPGQVFVAKEIEIKD